MKIGWFRRKNLFQCRPQQRIKWVEKACFLRGEGKGPLAALRDYVLYSWPFPETDKFRVFD
jgi:hypothetical protein